jgi:hypothetical protein
MGTAAKNKNGVKNSLVNNINARKKKRKSRPRSKSTVSKKSYAAMQRNWDKPKKRTKRAATKRPSKKRAAKKASKKTKTVGKRSRKK